MLKNCWSLISGTSGGIGKSIAKEFAKNGSNLLLLARDEEKLTNIKEELKEFGVEVHTFAFDISSYDEVKRFFKNLPKITKKLDIVINNAAVMHTSSIATTKKEDIDKVFQTNVFSGFYILSFASRMMLRAKKGSIVNINSIMGCSGASGHSLYSATKASISGFTKSLAKELAPFVRVNEIAPGVVDTKMIQKLSDEEKEKIIKNTPLNRIANPDEIAKVALFLSSDMASFITAECIRVDGGLCSI